MLNFLKQSRKLLNAKDQICIIVIGNETCDLDSAVCALSLAFFYQQLEQSQQETDRSKRWFLPVLNISRHDYSLKTEVEFLLKQSAITAEHLTFRDELQEEILARSNFILVDHHVSPFAARCIEVFDHRPLDSTANLPSNCSIHSELVGSCATLIADYILKATAANKDIASVDELVPLLRSTIVLDTINFSVTAARATPKDEEICCTLEQLLHKSAEEREQLFQMLCRARADISALTPLQLLHKDLKLLANADDSIRVALPGFPLPVQQFIRRPNAAADVNTFTGELNCAIVLLMGLYVNEEDGSVQRDIGLLNVSEPQLCTTILEKLLSCDDPELRLEQCSKCDNFMAGHFYQQKNIRATRKHILPVIRDVLNQWPRLDA